MQGGVHRQLKNTGEETSYGVTCHFKQDSSWISHEKGGFYHEESIDHGDGMEIFWDESRPNIAAKVTF